MTEPPWIQISPISPRGNFLAVGIDGDDVRARTRQADAVDVAAVNSPGIIVDGDVVSVAP